MKFSLQSRIGVTLMLYGCQDIYSTALLRQGIQCFHQAYFSNPDTCHPQGLHQFKSCLLTAIHEEHYEANENSNCCQAALWANVSILTVTWGLCLFFLTPHTRWGRACRCSAFMFIIWGDTERHRILSQRQERRCRKWTWEQGSMQSRSNTLCCN